MRATGFGTFSGNLPYVRVEVDLVPCGVSDFAASGCCESKDFEGGDGCPMGV